VIRGGSNFSIGVTAPDRGMAGGHFFAVAVFFILAGALGHEEVGGEDLGGGITFAFDDDFGAGLEHIGDDALVEDGEGLGFALDHEFRSEGGFFDFKVLIGDQAAEADAGGLVFGGGEILVDAEGVDPPFLHAGVSEVADGTSEDDGSNGELGFEMSHRAPPEEVTGHLYDKISATIRGGRGMWGEPLQTIVGDSDPRIKDF